MESLTLAEIERAANGRIAQTGTLFGRNLVINGVSTDTREMQRGCLFIPLIGEVFDGHQFVDEAARLGASAVFVDYGHWQARTDWPKSPAIIVVDDTLRALGRLAGYYRQRFDVLTIGITGSNGKTTTKDMIAGILSQRWPILYTRGNYNNEIGLPLTLLELSRKHRALVLEMGMRGMGQIRWLADIARPKMAVLTNIGSVHVELLGSIDNIARAKSELIESLPPDGVAVLNADDPRVLAMAKRAPNVVTYGIDNPADITASGISFRGFGGTTFRMQYNGTSREMLLPVIGRHHVLNALAAAAVALHIGFNWDEVFCGLKAFHHTSMRMEVREVAGIRIVNDAYNASPESMRAALRTLSELAAPNQTILVLGDMLELGVFSERAHREIGTLVRDLRPRALVAVGKMALYIAAEAGKEPGIAVYEVSDAVQASRLITRLVRPDDTVLVKASRGIGLEKVVHLLEEEMAEREEGGE